MVVGTRLLDTLRLLLHRRDRVYEAIERRERLGELWAHLVAVMVLCSAAYGAALGAWRAPLQGAYSAVKLPLLLLLTSGFVMLANWITSRMLQSQLSFSQVGVMSFLALALASLVLCSLAPIGFLFSLSMPGPAADHARPTHNVLLLLHVAVIGTAGLVGTRSLSQVLHRVPAAGPRARAIYGCWLASYVLVGCQLSWMLRPFIGSMYYPPQFVRRNALDGNFYEFLLADVIPRLLTGKKLHELI